MHIVFLCRAAAVVLLTTACCHSARGQVPLPPGLRVAGDDVSLQRVPANAGKRVAKNIDANNADTQACVLLKNDNVLFGHARQLGEFVIVTTAAGGEVRLPRLNVACWGENIRDLYQYRIDQRGKLTLRGHLRDARWCVRYDLYDLAARELIAARRIDPDSREANALESQLRNLVAPRAVPKPATARIGSGQTTSSIDQSTAITPAAYQDESSGALDFDPFTIRRFVSHIQPMLLNRCGVCHQTMARSVNNQSPVTDWYLTLPSVGSRASASITHSNLQSTTAYINAQSPGTSPLLVMATTAHGGVPASLSQRNTKAIQSLDQWVKMAAASLRNGQELSEQKNEESKKIFERNARFDGSAVSTLDRALEQSEGQSAAAPVGLPAQRALDDGANAAPHRLPPVSNPFDPDLFNRRFHAAKSD
ncbi:hypothetical protein N9276_01905 [Rhodopirellula sp.]|nr:hypothetical protein [Rhodopirellula sp.]